MTEPASRRSQPRWRGLVALVLLVAGSACQAVSRPQPLESVPAESTGGPAPASGQPSDPAGGPGQACQATVTVPADLEQRVATVEGPRPAPRSRSAWLTRTAARSPQAR